MRVIMAAVTITGRSMATRISLTTVAVSPVSVDMPYPAPTTWATSWMVAPRNTPAICGDNENQLAIIG
ncbi:hypothetical protein D3C81_1084240 [compost metagenome]